MEAQLIFLNILLEDKSYLAEPLHIMNILVLLELGHWARINVNCMIDGLQLEENGIAIYQGNYLVAVSSTFGSVGDRIQINLRNGTILNCIIADIKSSGDANYTQYGHAYGNKIYVVEPEIKRGQAGASGGTVTNWIPQWNSPPTKIINKGSVLN